MSSARFRVRFAGPLVSLQDAGRPGYMRFGVPGSGPMDRLGFAAAHAALGQPAHATAVEVSMGGLELTCLSGTVTVAMAGGGFAAAVNGATGDGWQVRTLAAGDTLSLRAGAWGSWCYLAFAGQVQAPPWLGHTATHAASGLGGGMLRSGMEFEVAEPRSLPDRNGDIPVPEIARPATTIRVVPGPQDHRFAPGATEALLQNSYTVSEAYDRMGLRLIGASLSLADALSIPSEPILRGSVQVSGDGVPTVLLADHQTTGGYPKIATVLSTDLDRLVQNRAGAHIRFVAVSPEEAIAAVRADHAARAEALEQIAQPRGSLEQRLLRENLISGVVSVKPPN